MAAGFNIDNALIHGGRNQALWVGSVISQVFGINSPIYIPWGKTFSALPVEYEASTTGQSPYHLPTFENLQFTTDDEAEERSIFGLPVLGVVRFESGTYNEYNRSTGVVERREYGRYTLPYSCLIDFSRQSNVITTNVMGNTGTVKELYGLGDWDINIRGIAVNGVDKAKSSALAQIDQLVRMQDINDAIEVSGDLFVAKGIHRIVIKNLNIQPVEAKFNVIPFQIQAVSDEPLELQL
ncbi:MAG: DUF6046 domain-containing protein [Prevotellaceae bacterium]|jgi:hypothetical protein|nr:DUF6046 domain-containing protein [Prevotellaceae bacterium]